MQYDPSATYLLPQPGPQTAFLSSRADIAIYGGAAGGGKTYALLLEAARNSDDPLFDAVTFRRTTPQITCPGGLWDGSCGLYPSLGAMPMFHRLEWRWPGGSRVKFAHLEDRKSQYDWQGAQIPLIQFDELTHFEQEQFWYMLSRNRSLTGMPGRIRATTNPDADSWVFALIEWYLSEDGHANPEKAGAMRYFVRNRDEMLWSEDRAELARDYGEDMVTSFAFYPARVEDNARLMETDPQYISRLNALPYVDRMRLRHGNWRIRATAGNIFKRVWFEVVDACEQTGSVVRYWDRASTKKKAGKAHDPDWTAGVKMRRMASGRFCVEDVVRLRDTPLKIQRAITKTASQDGVDVPIVLEQDPGQAGVSEISTLITLLARYNVRSVLPHMDKVARAKPLSAQAEAGNVSVIRGPWTEDYLRELENFPDGAHDDQVDGSSGAFNNLTGERRLLIV